MLWWSANSAFARFEQFGRSYFGSCPEPQLHPVWQKFTKKAQKSLTENTKVSYLSDQRNTIISQLLWKCVSAKQTEARLKSPRTLLVLYLIPHEGSNVAGLPSGCSTHVQDPFSRAGPEHMSHHYRGKVLNSMKSCRKTSDVRRQIVSRSQTNPTFIVQSPQAKVPVGIQGWVEPHQRKDSGKVAPPSEHLLL